jgi:hypothetical protein
MSGGFLSCVPALSPASAVPAMTVHACLSTEIRETLSGPSDPGCPVRSEPSERVVPTMVVKLYDPLVTVAALHVLAEAQRYAHSRGISLQAVVAPSAEHIFQVAGLEYLLQSASG